MPFEPSNRIQDWGFSNEPGGVNAAINDSATFRFTSQEQMTEMLAQGLPGAYIYSRHGNPTNSSLAQALAALEGSAAAQVTASGMAAISSTLLQLCSQGDEIISSRTVYGGTYALLKNLLPRFGIKVRFVDLPECARQITEKTRVIYCESMSNPLLEVADIPELSRLAREHGIKLVVDNTFSPLIVSPLRLGADIVIHSLTKFINGHGDGLAGVICGQEEFITSLSDINSGTTMLLGPVLDSLRAANILKNLQSLPVRMRKHSANAHYLAERLARLGLTVYYPGLASHRQHDLMKKIMNRGWGYGGMMAVDVGSDSRAAKLMATMQSEKIGYLAVSLGYFKTLFSAPSISTSSEIPVSEQQALGLGRGLIRFSIGLDDDIKRTFLRLKNCLKRLDII